MALLLAFAFLAGIVTVLSPCILPVLPVVLSGSVGGGKTRPWGIISGFIFSFSVFTLTLSGITRALGIPADVLRYVAAATVMLFGAIMVLPFLKDRFSAFASAVASAVASKKGKNPDSGTAGKGYWSGFALGVSLGLVWTPCVGPIMASVISLSLSGQTDSGSVFITLAYAAGTAIPLFLIMKGGRGLLNRFPLLSRNTDKVQKAFGLLMILTALALFTGADRSFQSWVLDIFPGYGSGLTALEERDSVRTALAARTEEAPVLVPDFSPRAGSPSSPDPLSLGSGVWINSGALSSADLRGKVVLVDFWTYSCINCVRTLPWLRAWNERYAAEGLVIIGVHSPEFAFERSEANVRKAVSDLVVTWPVVLDNDFEIWQAFSNRYWPAHYLYGRDGKLVQTHFGEGAYEETERLIQELLGSSGNFVSGTISGSVPITKDRSPETYLGYGRGERLSSPEELSRDAQARYSLPVAGLESDHWGFEGNWTLSSESSVSEAGSALAFRFKAAKVYLVINPLPGESAEILVSVDGVPVTTVDAKNGSLLLDSDRLYTLFDNQDPVAGTIRLDFFGRAEVYAFTFG
jgi:cytochrome c biogenesis protein CcdA/thiol-disulfide isomerase/thioredoxin